MQKAPVAVHHRSANLIPGDGTKNGLSRSEQKTVSTTQNNRLTGKAPYKSSANLASSPWRAKDAAAAYQGRVLEQEAKGLKRDLHVLAAVGSLS